MTGFILHNGALADVDPHGTLRYVADGVIQVIDGRIAFAGPSAEAPSLDQRLPTVDVGGRLVTPGLIDCHTHLIYAGNRLGDFLAARDPALDRGRFESGGIQATVRATTAASTATLTALARDRLDQMASHGVSVVEVKSGYGLSMEGERRMLGIARELSGYRGVTIVTSFLGAHALPVEFANRGAEYLAVMTEQVMPTLANEGLIDMVDCFIDPEGFSASLIGPYLARAKELGLPVRAHVDQFGPAGGAELAISYGAQSIDHVEHLSPAALASAGKAHTVAVLLPFATLHRSFTTNPPIQGLRDHGVPMAVATDLNPGTSPTTNLLLAAYLGVILYGLTPQEAFAGITRRAAQALGLSDRGALDTGHRLDLAIWEANHPYELVASVVDRRPTRLNEVLDLEDALGALAASSSL
ncbi:MAG: imidazolonepropionase [Ferrimicrobium sp.]|jgi:imidazolonepropionase|nr:imidazolonepropionase [Ferrimicrobium sp.]